MMVQMAVALGRWFGRTWWRHRRRWPWRWLISLERLLAKGTGYSDLVFRTELGPFPLAFFAPFCAHSRQGLVYPRFLLRATFSSRLRLVEAEIKPLRQCRECSVLCPEKKKHNNLYRWMDSSERFYLPRSPHIRDQFQFQRNAFPRLWLLLQRLLVRRYLQDLEEIYQLSGSSLGRYRFYLRHLLLWAGETPFQQVAKLRPTFPGYVSNLPGRLGETPLAPVSQKKIIEAGKRFFIWAKQNHPKEFGSLSTAWL